MESVIIDQKDVKWLRNYVKCRICEKKNDYSFDAGFGFGTEWEQQQFVD